MMVFFTRNISTVSPSEIHVHSQVFFPNFNFKCLFQFHSNIVQMGWAATDVFLAKCACCCPELLVLLDQPWSFLFNMFFIGLWGFQVLHPTLLGIDEWDSWLCSGTNLTERFRDQFSPLLVDQNVPWSLSNSTVIRMPFSPECMKDGLDFGLNKISMMLDKFLNNASAMILFLKSLLQVILHFQVGCVVPF